MDETMNNGLSALKNQYKTGDLIYRPTLEKSPGPGWLNLSNPLFISFNSPLGKTLNYKQNTWNTQTNDLTSSLLQGVAYGNGTWVVVSNFGEVRTSTNDGVTLNRRNSLLGIGGTASAVAYGNGTWVIVYNAGTLRTSTNDGVTWNAQTSNFGTTNIFSVAYGNGVWVAGGTAGTLRTSTDNGVTWNTQTSQFTTSILDVVYGNGVWVAVGTGGTIRTSIDAISWTTTTSNSSSTSAISSVEYGNGTFMAVGTNGLVRTLTNNGSAYFPPLSSVPAGYTVWIKA